MEHAIKHVNITLQANGTNLLVCKIYKQSFYSTFLVTRVRRTHVVVTLLYRWLEVIYEKKIKVRLLHI